MTNDTISYIRSRISGDRDLSNAQSRIQILLDRVSLAASTNAPVPSIKEASMAIDRIYYGSTGVPMTGLIKTGLVKSSGTFDHR